jgi:hypothetical protein
MNTALALASTLPPPGEEFPPCHCATPVPWHQRRLDPPLWLDPAHESRTCRLCGATKTIVHCEESERGVKCSRQAHWYVTPTRLISGGREPYHACEDHTIEAIRYTYCEVEDLEGFEVQVSDNSELVRT